MKENNQVLKQVRDNQSTAITKQDQQHKENKKQAMLGGNPFVGQADALSNKMGAGLV